MGYETKKVLIVDDSSLMRHVIKKNLEQLGFNESNLSHAEDGQSAMEKLDDDSVDLVISDWIMPKMNGIEFLKKVRSKDSIKNLPFLLVTSEANVESIMEAVKEGVSHHIVKPFSAKQLEEKIKQIFQ